MAAMLHLSFGAAMAADTTEAQQTQSPVIKTPENPPKPKEETPSTSTPKSTTATTEEPDCNN
jgi:hypothetical protein